MRVASEKWAWLIVNQDVLFIAGNVTTITWPCFDERDACAPSIDCCLARDLVINDTHGWANDRYIGPDCLKRVLATKCMRFMQSLGAPGWLLPRVRPFYKHESTFEVAFPPHKETAPNRPTHRPKPWTLLHLTLDEAIGPIYV